MLPPLHKKLGLKPGMIAGLQNLSLSAKLLLKKNGMLWIFWPKGSSRIEKEINRELIRDYILGIGMVDVKVASLEEDWSGLKFVYRLKDR